MLNLHLRRMGEFTSFKT